MSIPQFDLKEGQRAERKKLLTVVEWQQSDGRFYVVQTSQPADWSTNFTSYYTKSSDTYSPVTGTSAPTWATGTYYTRVEREILGTRTEDSSVEFNADIETTTDIRGNNYTDLNKTQPQQSFDPYLVLGGSKLGPFLHDIMLRNAVSELNQFTAYLVTSYITVSDGNTKVYRTQKQDQCTITYDSLGGDANVNFPITLYYSNKSTNGTIDKLADDFTFTADVTV